MSLVVTWDAADKVDICKNLYFKWVYDGFVNIEWLEFEKEIKKYKHFRGWPKFKKRLYDGEFLR